jgi:hypothetical protein
MKLLAMIITSVLAVAVAPTSQAQNGGAQICAADIRAAVAAALEHSLEAAKDLPDLGVLAHERGTIYVLEYVSENDCLLDRTVLPTSATQIYVLVGREQLSKLAARTKDGVSYVRAGDVHIGGGEGRFWLGVSIQRAPGDQRPLVCCCGGLVVLRRVASQWEFQEWKNIMCA